MALTDISHPTDIAMLTDLYELTMAQGLWESGKANEQGCFTAFYRDHPFGSAYAVMCGTADGKVQRAVQAHVLDGLLEVDVTYDPHLRELDLRAAGTQDLLLEERYGREAPAGAAAVLVGDGHRLHRLRVGELVALGGLLLVLCRRRDCGAGQNRCQKHR